MEALSVMQTVTVKLGILAALFDILGIIGLAALLISIIWLIIRVANFDSIIPALICILLSLAVVAAGFVLSPAPDVGVEPIQAPWERFLNQDDAPRKKDPQDTEPGGDGGQTQPDTEGAEAVTTSGPADSAPSTAEGDGVLIDEVLNGWRVRLTLPGEWKDSCVVENSNGSLFFYWKDSQEDSGGLAGCLMVRENPADPDNPEFWLMDGQRITIGQDGGALVSEGSADAPDNGEAPWISDEYKRMQMEIPQILSALEFERA